MTLSFRDPSIPDSPLSRWDARWKLAALLFASFSLACLRTLPAISLGFLACLLLALATRMPVRSLRNRLSVIVLSVLPFLLILPLECVHDSTRTVVPVQISKAGTLQALSILVRGLSIGLLVCVLLGSTPLPTMFAAAHALHLPGALVLIAQLAYRYTFVLIEEARRLRIAFRTRGFRARANPHTYRTLGHTAGALIVRGAERGDRVAEAMRCRGFDGTVRSLTPFRTRPLDIVAFAVVVSASIALLIWDQLYPP